MYVQHHLNVHQWYLQCVLMHILIIWLIRHVIIQMLSFFVQFYSPLIIKSSTDSILSCSCTLMVRSCATSDADELYDYYSGTVFLHCDDNQSVALSYIHVVENVFYSRYDYLQLYFGSNISVQIPSFASLTVFYTKKT